MNDEVRAKVDKCEAMQLPDEPTKATVIITSSDFEKACEAVICGSLWDSSFNPDYTEGVSLSVAEMRAIANIMREREGNDPGRLYDVVENPNQRSWA